jgi:hypothetical protein
MADVQEYPRHVHKPGGEFLVVHDNAARDAAVAAGWFLTPLEAQQGVPEAPVSGEGTGDDLAAAVGLSDDAIPETLEALTVAQAGALTEVCDDVARLTAWYTAEADGKARKGVLKALEARLELLAQG